MFHIKGESTSKNYFFVYLPYDNSYAIGLLVFSQEMITF